MINKQTIETQLDCRATATLRSEIALDLSVPDRPIQDVLENKEITNESESQPQNSGGDCDTAS